MMFTFESDVFRFIDGETGRRESEVFLSFHMSDSILVLISCAHAHDVTIISLLSSFTIIFGQATNEGVERIHMTAGPE